MNKSFALFLDNLVLDQSHDIRKTFYVLLYKFSIYMYVYFFFFYNKYLNIEV